MNNPAAGSEAMRPGPAWHLDAPPRCGTAGRAAGPGGRGMQGALAFVQGRDEAGGTSKVS